MRIDFFTTNEGMDERAVRGGVYHVELLNKNTDSLISLYIGESVWIVARCGEHLYSLYDNPNYFGLTKEDLEDDDLTLRFSVLEEIEGKKSVLGVGKYKDTELKYIQKNNPITQFRTSDRQLNDIDKKVQNVQFVMGKYGFKK